MNRNEAERKFLIVYSILALFFLALGVTAPVPLLILLGTVPEMAVCWVLYGGQKSDGKTRAVVMTVCALVSTTCFGAMSYSMDVLLPLFAVVLAMVGLFNIRRLLGLWVAEVVLMFLYHLLVRRTYPHDSLSGFLTMLYQIFCLALMYYLEKSLIQKNIERNRQLMGMIVSLQESEHSKDEFMSSVSHELRTPLNIICGMGELIARSDVPEEVQGSAANILASGRGMQEFVSDVFDYMEIERGRLALREEEYNFASLLMNIVDIADAQNAEKKLDIIIDCDANIPCAMVGDSEKIRKVIMCLMSNAIKFTDKGFVSLKVSVRKETYGVNLCIGIKDTGIGMSKEDVDRIFTDFNRVDGEADSRHRGVGLGLTLTRRLVEIMKGLINVTSEPGVGSEFRVVIPQRVTDGRPMVEVPDRERIKVLIYINIEKYSMPELRSAYVKWIRDVEKKMGIGMELITDISQCKRMVENNSYTQLVTTLDEYRQEPWYFEMISKKLPVIMVMERDEQAVIGGNFIVIYKPLTILSAVEALAGHSQRVRDQAREDGFKAPEAKVLVVDDTVMNLKVMEGLLKKYDIVPYTVTSGAAALNVVNSIRFDLIFMDYMMPGMDGVAALKELRTMEDTHYRTLPVICLTANAVSGAREQMIGQGFDDFLAKPVDVTRLEEILRAWLPEERLKAADSSPAEAKAAGSSPAGETAAPQERKAYEERPSRIDRVIGENYCGGKESYQEILKVFYEYGAEKRRELKKLYEQKNWSGYAIEVHALKSTALGIGAVELSELAKTLELAAKQENEPILEQNHETAMKEYRAVLTEIAEGLE